MENFPAVSARMTLFKIPQIVSFSAVAGQLRFLNDWTDLFSKFETLQHFSELILSFIVLPHRRQ